MTYSSYITYFDKNTLKIYYTELGEIIIYSILLGTRMQNIRDTIH